MVAEQSNLPSDQDLQGNTMTHISDCIRSDIGLGLNNLIAKGLYSEPPEDEVGLFSCLSIRVNANHDIGHRKLPASEGNLSFAHEPDDE